MSVDRAIAETAWATRQVAVLPVVLVLGIGISGCGEGLLGTEGIRSITGSDDLELPQRPAWGIRWMLADGAVDGPVQQIASEGIYLEYEQDEESWYHFVNYLEVQMPDLQDVPPEAVRGDTEHVTFAVGLPMLLDDVDGDGQWKTPTAEDPAELWGVTPEAAFMYLDGDLGQVPASCPVALEEWSEYCNCQVSLHQGLQNVWLQIWILEMWEWWQEFPEQPEEVPEAFLWPDHPDVARTYHPQTFLVSRAATMDNDFPGGARAFLGEAWWSMFADPVFE